LIDRRPPFSATEGRKEVKKRKGTLVDPAEKIREGFFSKFWEEKEKKTRGVPHSRPLLDYTRPWYLGLEKGEILKIGT